ncbi:MAG: ADP-ribosylglycohydrolase family protein, partial [archaeon]
EIDEFVKEFTYWGEKNLEEEKNPRYWWRYPGTSSIGAARKLMEGIPWQESGSDKPTCGSSMRVSPIGLTYPFDFDRLKEYAEQSSIPSHKHRQSIAGAVAVATAVGLAVRDEFNLGDIKMTVSGYDKEMADIILKIRINADYWLEEYFSKHNSWLARETVPAALYFADKYIDNPEEAIIRAVNNGGDTDSIACITGAIVGAATDNIEKVPKRWIQGLEDVREIAQLADALCAISEDEIRVRKRNKN